MTGRSPAAPTGGPVAALGRDIEYILLFCVRYTMAGRFFGVGYANLVMRSEAGSFRPMTPRS